MLSAVESNSSHLGSSRAYNVHHHLAYGSVGGGVGPSPSITAGTGLNTYPSNVVPVMSSAEFVKPHPKLNRYSNLPSRNGSSSAGGGLNGGLPPSPIASSNSKFKYATGPEQPVNLAMGSGNGPSATSSPISSPQQQQQMPPSGMDKLTYAEYLYSRHAAAAGFLAPQNYPPLMYQTTTSPGGPGGPATNGMPAFPGHPGQQSPQQSMKKGNNDHGSPRMSPPTQVERNGGAAVHLSTEALLNSHRYQQQQQQQQQFHHQQQQMQQQQKALKGSSAGFMLPPNPSMLPTQAELEAFHAYHQGAVEMNNRLYYNGHGGGQPQPPPQSPASAAEHLINAQRLQQQQQQQQQKQQSPNNLPPQSSMSRSHQSQGGKRAIQQQQGGDAAAMYHLSHRQQQQNGSGSGGKGGGGGGANQSPQDKNNNIGFKVPSSGKETVLKHRQLNATKAKGKGGKQQNGIKSAGSSNSNSNSSYGTSNIIKSNFNKGVLIELGNGELKPVEEMRTEDFILSSNVTPDLEMIDSTILRIMPHGNVIVLTLSNSASKLNIDLTVAPEHPFFVYRQGWASCNPEGTYQMHGLKCQRLEVGDVCISLMQKERSSVGAQQQQLQAQEAMMANNNEENINNTRTTSASSSTSSTSSATSSLSSPPPAQSQQQQQQQQSLNLNHIHQHHQQQQQHQLQQEEPQNLSRKPSPMKPESRSSIEGTTHHPSLLLLNNNNNHSSSPHSSSSNAQPPPTHSTINAMKNSSSNGSVNSNVNSCNSNVNSSNNRDVSMYPVDIPQPLHALVHAHLTHAPPPTRGGGIPPQQQHQNQEHLHQSLAPHQNHHNEHSSNSLFRDGQGGNGGQPGNPLMNSFLSTIKHNYLAAFEAAKAAQAMNEKLNNGISHSIKNIVMGGDQQQPINNTANNGQYDARYPRQYSPNINGSPGLVSSSSSSLSPGSNGGSSSSKRRYSAPDNVFGEDNNGQRSRDGRLEHEEPPKKIASH